MLEQEPPLSVINIDGDDVSVVSDITLKTSIDRRFMQLLQHSLKEESPSWTSISHKPTRNEDENFGIGVRAALSRYYPWRTVAEDYPTQQEEGQSNTNCFPGMPTRRFTEPPASSSHYHSSCDHINTIVELKLQVAQQKELIDRLTSDLNHALAEKEAFLSNAKRPTKPVFDVTSLSEEKAHSDNSRSLHHQYNELREEMNCLRKSMDLQQEKMAALEEDNKRLSKETNSLQHQICGTSFKISEDLLTSSPVEQEKMAALEEDNKRLSKETNSLQHQIRGTSFKISEDLLTSDPVGSQERTASSTEYSALSEFSNLLDECELKISPTDLAHSCCYNPKRNTVNHSQDELALNSYLPWSESKRRFSEPVVSQGQKEKVTRQASPKGNKNGWFIGDENESSFLSKLIYRREGTKVIAEDTQALSSIPSRQIPMVTLSSELR